MTIQFPVALRGVPGSPYTRKMLSVLRYRHIPYRYLIRPHGRVEGLPSPKVELLPTFYLPAEDGHLEAVVDSTPIIRRLEREVHGRSVVPTDPVLRYVDEFLEDFGDEWLTKAMFHYRWAFEADIAQAASILPRWANLTGADDAIARGAPSSRSGRSSGFTSSVRMRRPRPSSRRTTRPSSTSSTRISTPVPS